jgi:putative ABC transport system permease protein
MEDQQSEILLVTPEREMTAEVLPRVKEYFNSQTGGNKYLALSYQETSDLLPYMEIAQLIYNQVYIFIVLLSSIVVINTMIMIIKERTREIGMMSALGMKSGGILKLFILEGAVMGIIGSFFGSIIGSIINNYFAVNGIDFTAALSGFDSEIMISSIIYTQSSIFNSVFAFLIGAVVVTLSCILPARRAAKLEPTAAMKER